MYTYILTVLSLLNLMMSCSFRHLYTKTKISSKSTNFVHTLNIIKICTIIFYIHAYIYIIQLLSKRIFYIYNSPADVLLSKNRCDLKKKYYFFLNLILRFSFVCQLYTHGSPLQNFFCCTCFTKNREEYKYLFRL